MAVIPFISQKQLHKSQEEWAAIRTSQERSRREITARDEKLRAQNEKEEYDEIEPVRKLKAKAEEGPLSNEDFKRLFSLALIDEKLHEKAMNVMNKDFKKSPQRIDIVIDACSSEQKVGKFKDEVLLGALWAKEEIAQINDEEFDTALRIAMTNPRCNENAVWFMVFQIKDSPQRFNTAVSACFSKLLTSSPSDSYIDVQALKTLTGLYLGNPSFRSFTHLLDDKAVNKIRTALFTTNQPRGFWSDKTGQSVIRLLMERKDLVKDNFLNSEVVKSALTNKVLSGSALTSTYALVTNFEYLANDELLTDVKASGGERKRIGKEHNSIDYNAVFARDAIIRAKPTLFISNPVRRVISGIRSDVRELLNFKR